MKSLFDNDEKRSFGRGGFEIFEDSNGFSLLGTVKVLNTTNLGLLAALSDYWDGYKLSNVISTIMAKGFEVLVKKVRRRFVNCKKEYAIKQQMMKAGTSAEYTEKAMMM